MAIFSVFTGLIYNEAFSIPLTVFGGSRYSCPSDPSLSLIDIRPNEESCPEAYTTGLVLVRCPKLFFVIMWAITWVDCCVGIPAVARQYRVRMAAVPAILAGTAAYPCHRDLNIVVCRTGRRTRLAWIRSGTARARSYPS